MGNPPWVRWSRLPEAYRAKVKAFCDYYGLVSGRGYSGGIESDISTVITFSAADRWLVEGGTIALLITWTVFKSGSARGFRIGRLPGDYGLKVERIEDLTRLQAFADAANETAVYVAKKVRPASLARFASTDCRIWRPKPGKSRIQSGIVAGPGLCVLPHRRRRRLSGRRLGHAALHGRRGALPCLGLSSRAKPLP